MREISASLFRRAAGAAKTDGAMFNTVMVAIASISLLVAESESMKHHAGGDIGTNPEIGVRRAVGRDEVDIIRQFVIEAVLISFAGGLVGVGAGFLYSQLIAWLAGWSTIVTVSSILWRF